jgi:hypothetical protein
MMSIEFMTGAMLLSSIKMALAMIFIWVLYRAGLKFYTYIVDDSDTKTLNLKWELAYIFGVVMVSIFMGSAAQPKLEIDVPVNRNLIEYQSGEEVVIETPEPRTEKLEGFTPLKKD